MINLNISVMTNNFILIKRDEKLKDLGKRVKIVIKIERCKLMIVKSPCLTNPVNHEISNIMFYHLLGGKNNQNYASCPLTLPHKDGLSRYNKNQSFMIFQRNVDSFSP